MKVLIVCSGNAPDFSFEKNQAFVFDQVNAIVSLNKKVSFSYFFIKGKGVLGYLKNLTNLKTKIQIEMPDLIHAHYAQSGLLSNLQRGVKVISAFHGSDINTLNYRILSIVVHILGSYSIFVSNALRKKINPINKFSVIPCGVDLDLFFPAPKDVIRIKLSLNAHSKYILFSSAFDNPVKNYNLAKVAIGKINEPVEIMELKDMRRADVRDMFNAVDLLLLTSFSEGSPQVIKEAMACNCPIVATDVGDIKDVIGDTEGCYITSFEPQDIADKVKLALAFGKRTDGRERIKRLDSKIIAEQVLAVYQKVLMKRYVNK